jgi:putative membrane protein
LAWWQAGLMWLAMIAFLALLIWVVYALVTGITRRPDQAGPGDARRILDERLARGEIGADDYQRLRDLPESGPARSAAGSGSAR